MTKASDNAFPSLLITEGTEPSAPAAGKQRLYIDSTTHHLTRTDSSAVEVDIESAAAGNMATDTLWDAAGDLAVGTGANTAHKLTAGAAGTRLISGGAADPVWTTFPASILYLTSGDVTISATTGVYASNITGLSDITIAAATNDYIEVGISNIVPNSTAQSVKYDVITVVSAAAVNFLSTGGASGASNGMPGWYVASGATNAKSSGSVYYKVVSGDISGGNVTLRLLCWVSASTRVIGASTTNALVFFAKNHRQ